MKLTLFFVVFATCLTLCLAHSNLQKPKLNPDGSRATPVADGSLYASGEQLLFLFEYDHKLAEGVGKVLKYSSILTDLFKEAGIYSSITTPMLNPPWNDPLVLFHPINQYMLVYKFSKTWPRFSRYIGMFTKNGSDTSTWEKLFGNYHIDFEKVMPMLKDIATLTVSELDLKKAALGILRLQETYHLNTSDILKGKIRGHPALRALTYPEIEVFVEAATEYQDNCRALHWLKEMAKMTNKKYQLSLAISLKKNDLAECAQTFCMRGDLCKKEKNFVEINYENLCRDPEKYSKPDPHLQCGHWTHSPEFYWKPLKIEWMKQNPPLFVIYDFFTDTEADQLLQSSPPMTRGVLVSDDKNKQFSETRSGTTAWVGDHDAPIVAKLSSRVGRAINKTMKTADKWQLGNYGIGGQYYFHSDYFEEKYLPQQWFYPLGWQNRMVTFMVYLEEVYEGGYTAFPLLEIAVKPVKGSAVVWHNLKSDGTVDDRTYHGGCPVLLGNKKIANKWIHYGGELFTTQCKPKNDPLDHDYQMSF